MKITDISEEERLYCDLEFVQNLCNARYLNYLAQNQYFKDEKFLNYLKYLQYWKQPEYTQLLRFPHSLAFLDALIHNAEFRDELAKPTFANYVHQQQGLHWSNFVA